MSVMDEPKNPPEVTLRIGTRGSELALAQARQTRDALQNHLGPSAAVELKIIKTTGDARLDLSLAHTAQSGPQKGLDKGLFTKELEDALLSGEIDVAVHSLKDLPTEMPNGLVLSGVLPRAPVEDVLVARVPPETADRAAPASALPEGATLATSSLRRMRLWQWQRPDLRFLEIRGNVQTRLRKVAQGLDGMHATILARAGLERLGVDLRGGSVEAEDGTQLAALLLPADLFPPAVGQGIIGLQTRADDEITRNAMGAIRDSHAWHMASVERGLLRAMGGGCQTPLAVLTKLNGKDFSLKTLAFDAQGQQREPWQRQAEGPLAEAQSIVKKLADEWRESQS
jgi:hydroxymethylbilane synthase